MRLEWHLLRAKGRVIAAHLAARVGSSISVPKIAYDEDYARYAPGNVLVDRCVERACADDGVAEVNFLTDMPWHRNWRMPQDRYHDLWLIPRRPLWRLLDRAPAQFEDRARERLGPPARQARDALADRGRRLRSGSDAKASSFTSAVPPANS